MYMCNVNLAEENKIKKKKKKELKIKENGLFFVFSADYSKKKNSHSLGKIFKCFKKISFSSFKKCYGLLGSGLPLTRFLPMKIQSVVSFADSAIF